METKRKPSPGRGAEGKRPSLKLVAKRAGGEQDQGSKSDGKEFLKCVRCRPLPERARKQPESVVQLSKGAVTICGRRRFIWRRLAACPRRAGADERSSSKSFSFDHVYDERSSQSVVYDEFVAPYCGMEDLT